MVVGITLGRRGCSLLRALSTSNCAFRLRATLDHGVPPFHYDRVAAGLDVGAAGRRAFAATWRDEHDQVAGTTSGGTMCWFPRKPGRLRIQRDGYEHIVRCGECPGCIELNRRRLADRLSAKYASDAVGLFLTRIYVPLGIQAAVSHNLHRRPRLGLEPGLYRLGISSFAVLTRAPNELHLALNRAGLRHRSERVRFKRGRRAWRGITAGLLVSRDQYGEQVKRWYCRGLPPAEKETWQVVKREYQKGYSRLHSPRAWTADKLVLVPPDVWKLGRNDRRRVRELLRRAPDPESARVVIDLVAAVTAKVGRQLTVNAAPSGRLTREQVQAWYKSMAEKKAASAAPGSGSESLPPLSGEGGIRRRVHS